MNLPESINFPEEELKTLEYWKEKKAFETSLLQSQNRKRYSFYDGPPFATGLPHYGHLLAGTIKDIVTRFAHQRGFYVDRRFGWDCHGLPVEYEIDKELGITGPQDVEKMGIAAYNEKCRSIVMRYSKEWEVVVNRLGRWIDFKNDYKTMYPTFMESVWWVFKQMYEKGLVYRGVKVMPFSTACSTPLSNFEAGQNYRDVDDPAIVISFPLESDPGVEFVAWTTTPWTLPSNLALCVNPEMDYVRLEDAKSHRKFILMEARIQELYKKESDYTVLAKMKGKELEGLSYKPLFPYFVQMKTERTAFRVLCDNYVTADSGTGIVHQAPYFGEDDYRVCLANGIITKDMEMICPVDATGRFEPVVSDFKGMHVKEADKHICKHLKDMGRLVHHGSVKHSYPFCWRSDTPLIYKAVPTWFIAVERLTDKLLSNNAKSYWMPDFVKEKRFGNWLRDARDWAVSRNRYWGTPMPIWVSDDFEEVVCVGSVEELKRLSGVEVKDLHRESIDSIIIPSRQCKGVLRRIPEVFDCWFESGAMPYAQVHYPFENVKVFEDSFPADFIAEGVDQTRGWFYTLLVISTALFDQPPFKNLIVNGIVLAEDGTKMSKRLRNYPDPNDILNNYGADALRLYLINSPVVRAQDLRFKEAGVRDIVKDCFLPWYNGFRFLFMNGILRYESAHGNQLLKFRPDDLPRSSNYLDRWILSALESLNQFVREEMDAYRLYTVLSKLIKFVDNLTNWFLRMNRKRLKGDGSGDSNDWLMVLHTLFYVFHQLSRLFSPFTPFLTEFFYQRMRSRLDFSDMLKEPSLPVGYDKTTGAPESVHYLMLPQLEPGLIHAEIEESFSRMQSVIDLGRVIRERRHLPLKAPLKEVVVVHSDKAVLRVVESMKSYILQELNVRDLTVTDDKEKYGVELKAYLNHRTLGVRLKGAYKAVVEAAKTLSTEQLESYLRTNQITLAGENLSGDDMSVVFGVAGVESNQYETATDNSGLLVLLDVQPDQGLEDEWTAREIVNRIQRLRKKAKLSPEDPIRVQLITDSATLKRVFGSYRDFIDATVKQPTEAISQTNQPTKADPIINEVTSIKNDSLQVFIYSRQESTTIPVCPFVNVFCSGSSKLGTVLLRNPNDGPQLPFEQLVRQVIKLFSLTAQPHDLHFHLKTKSSDIEFNGAVSQDTTRLNGQLLFVRQASQEVSTAVAVADSGRMVPFVNVVLMEGNEETKRKATVLLKNPEDGPLLVFDELSRNVRSLFGWTLPPHLRLYKRSAGNLQLLTHEEDLADLNRSTLYASFS